MHFFCLILTTIFGVAARRSHRQGYELGTRRLHRSYGRRDAVNWRFTSGRGSKWRRELRRS